MSDSSMIKIWPVLVPKAIRDVEIQEWQVMIWPANLGFIPLSIP